jgi:septal ring factor EnvC (AmiA/AmiB activator)
MVNWPDDARKLREYDSLRAERDLLREQRDKAYAAEREHTAELKAQIARLQAELDEASQHNVLHVRKSAIIEAMAVSEGEAPGTIVRATDEPGLAFVLEEDRQWVQLP